MKIINLEKYQDYSSLAIWNDDNKGDTSIVEKNLHQLNNKIVMVGLNISKSISPYKNFHGGKHDRKLCHLFNDSSYKHGYMTDLIKNEIASRSTDITRKIKNREIDINKHVHFFIQEMNDIGVSNYSLMILFGRDVTILFNKYLRSIYPNFVTLRHYSDYSITDEEWIDDSCNILKSHYQKTKDMYGTLKFERYD